MCKCSSKRPTKHPVDSTNLWTSKQRYCHVIYSRSPRKNFQAVNFQRCKRAFYQRQASVKLQLALCLLLLTILQLNHLPLTLLQSCVALLACSLNASSWMPAVILYYCTFQGTVLMIRNVCFLCLLCIICL